MLQSLALLPFAVTSLLLSLTLMGNHPFLPTVLSSLLTHPHPDAWLSTIPIAATTISYHWNPDHLSLWDPNADLGWAWSPMNPTLCPLWSIDPTWKKYSASVFLASFLLLPPLLSLKVSPQAKPSKDNSLQWLCSWLALGVHWPVIWLVCLSSLQIVSPKRSVWNSLSESLGLSRRTWSGPVHAGKNLTTNTAGASQI